MNSVAHTLQHLDNRVKQTRAETRFSQNPHPGKITEVKYCVAFEACCHTLCIFYFHL